MSYRELLVGLVVLAGLFAYLYFRSRHQAPRLQNGQTSSGVPARFNLDSKQEARLKQALAHLRQHGEITNKEYRKMVKVSRRHAVRDLDLLEKQGYIKQIGKIGYQVKYRLIKR